MPLDVTGCLNQYNDHGVLFAYPDIWELQEEVDGNGDIVLTVSTEGTCFWALRILTERPAASDVISSCVAAFREEYEDMDEYPLSGYLAEMPASGRMLEFSCLELINSVCLYSITAANFSLLVWWQGTDHELDDIRPVFEQMTNSVRVSGPVS